VRGKRVKKGGGGTGSRVKKDRKSTVLGNTNQSVNSVEGIQASLLSWKSKRERYILEKSGLQLREKKKTGGGKRGKGDELVTILTTREG